MGVIAETAVRVKADTAGFQTGVMGAIGKVAVAAGAALGGLAIGKALFVDPIKSAAVFEQTLNVLKETSGATGAEMKSISNTAMKLGADIKLPGTSASDAATAMLELAKGGFTAKESMASARGVLLLSAAAQIDNATAAQMTADTLNAFGMEANQAMVVVDAFAGAANSSTASMGDVGAALQQSGQAFKGLGIPVGDAATAIAAMANAGIKGSDAGTSLKTMLARLTPDTKKAKEAFRDMGIDVFDSNGKFIGMEKTIAQIGPKLKGLTMEQKAQKLETMFGSDASRAAAVVFGMSAKQFDNLRDKVTKAGQAQRLADAQSKGFKGAMEGLRSTIQTLQLQIGLKMLPVLTKFVRFLASNLPAAAAAAGEVLGAIGGVIGGAIRDVAKWLGVFQSQANDMGLDGLASGVETTKTRFDQLTDAVRAVAAVVGPVLRAAFESARAAIERVVGVVAELVEWLNENRDVMVAAGAAVAVIVTAMIAYELVTRTVRAAIMIATAAQAAFNAVVMMNPIGLAVLAIAALVAALVLLYTRSETARAIMDAAFRAIRAAVDASITYITNTVIPAAIAAWNRFGPGVVAALQSAASAIRSVVEAIATVVRTVVEQIRAHWEGVWKVFGPLVRTQLEIVRTVVTTVLNVVAGVIRLFAALLRGDWSAAWDALKGIVTDVLNGVVSIVRSALGGLAGTARGLAETVGAAIGNGVKAGLSALAGLAGDLAGRISAAASQAAGSAFTYARQIGFSVADGVISGIGNLASRLGSALASAANAAKDWALSKIGASSPSKLFRDTIGKAIGDGITLGADEGMRPLGPKMTAKLRELSTTLKNAATKELPEVGKAIGAWATAAQANFDTQIDRITKTIDLKFTKAQAKLDAWKAKLTPAEFQIAQQEAAAAVARVQGDVAAAAAALQTLPAKQAAAWSALLAQQAANMAALRATLTTTTTDALTAQHDFGQALASASPAAAMAIEAQKHADHMRIQFEAGLATQGQYLAAHDALQAAELAINDNTDAQKLLSDYNTWQSLVKQQTDAAAAITAQQAADNAAQTEMRGGFATERQGLQETYNQALQAREDFYLHERAEKERAAKDARYNAMTAGLKATHDRVVLHLENVKHAHDLHYAELGRMASRGGENIGDNLAAALRRSLPTVAAASAAVANTIAQYLRLRSPAEKGPLASVNTWWSKLGPTLVQGFDSSGMQSALAGAVTPPSARPFNANRLGMDRGGMGSVNQGNRRVEEELRRIRQNTEKTANQKPVQVQQFVTGSVGIDASVYRSRR